MSGISDEGCPNARVCQIVSLSSDIKFLKDSLPSTVVIAYKNTGYKNISVIRTISPGNRFSSYSFVLEEYRL